MPIVDVRFVGDDYEPSTITPTRIVQPIDPTGSRTEALTRWVQHLHRCRHGEVIPAVLTIGCLGASYPGIMSDPKHRVPIASALIDLVAWFEVTGPVEFPQCRLLIHVRPEVARRCLGSAWSGFRNRFASTGGVVIPPPPGCVERGRVVIPDDGVLRSLPASELVALLGALRDSYRASDIAH